ncbi:unnamed protein product [Amoebophrya sp. A25]|nr:unnamed protein product [Amoebophrya sp. A25]|eukprot:GSA25T00026740001.1
MPPASARVSASAAVARWHTPVLERKPLTQFVSFDEFKVFVRKLGFTCSRDFQKWSSSSKRPPFIPSTPNKYYKNEGWKSFMDALGYDWPPVRTSILASQRTYKNRQFRNAQKAVDWVEKTILELTGGRFEVYPVPRFGRVSFLLRKRRSVQRGGDEQLDDAWWALRVKSAADRCKKSSKKRESFIFCLKQALTESDVGFVAAGPQFQEIDFLHPADLPLHVSKRNPSGCSWFYLANMPVVDTEGGRQRVVERLLALLDRLPTKPLQEWLAHLPASWGSELRHLLAQQLISNLLRPAGLSFAHAGKLAELHNAVIGGKRVLLRCARIVEETGKSKIVLERNRRTCVSADGKKLLCGVPFDASDEIDFLLAMMYCGEGDRDPSAKLDGVFVFPKSLLIDMGVMSVDFKGGRFGFALYPPGCAPPHDNRRERALKQKEFYFALPQQGDQRLSKAETVEEMRERMRALFLGNYDNYPGSVSTSCPLIADENEMGGITVDDQ